MINDELEQIDDEKEREENKDSWGGLDAQEYIKEILTNEHIEDYIKKKWWVLFSNTAKLTFLDQNGYKTLMLQFELLRINTLESVPKSEYNEELEDILIQIKMEFEMNLRRAMGNGRLNTIEIMGMQTRTTFRSRDLEGNDNQGSWGSRLKHMFTGR